MRKLKVFMAPLLDQIQSRQEIHLFCAINEKLLKRKTFLIAQ